MFTKEIGVPIYLIVDSSGEQMSNEINWFCPQIGKTHRILEEDKQHTHRLEFYIGLLEETVRKDMRDLNCLIVLWDYFADQRAWIYNLTARNMSQLEGHNP